MSSTSDYTLIPPPLPGFDEDDLIQLVKERGFGVSYSLGYRWNAALSIAQGAYQRGLDHGHRFGAFHELNNCLAEIRKQVELPYAVIIAERVERARRVAPPTLKQQALTILEVCDLDPAQKNTIRAALEALPE